MDILVFLLSYSGLFTLCLAMPKQFQVMLSKPCLPYRPLIILRITGWLILSLSFAMAVKSAGWTFGPVKWVGFLSLGGLLLIFLVPHAPRLALTLGVLSLLSVPLTLIIH